MIPIDYSLNDIQFFNIIFKILLYTISIFKSGVDYMKRFFLIALFSQSLFGLDLTWSNLSLIYAKDKNLTDLYVYSNDYIHEVHNHFWSKNHDDEFAFEEKRDLYIQEMKTKILNINITKEEFFIYTSVNFGQYNFKTKTFPLTDKPIKSSYYSIKPKNISSYKVSAFPKQYNIFFNNPEVIKDVTLAKKQAKDFLQTRKDRYGNINRKLTTKITFKIKKLQEIERNVNFITEITNVEYIFND